jgi:ABC-type polysaccharide/polyol phosphate transport system ATPase subunit
MSDVVIRAEGLGKKYLIGHVSSRERYTALRDVIARGAKGLARSAFDMLRGRELVAGDEVEEFWALKDVSFEIERGEVVGIIGRNGAGKSTLLKILSRITEPSVGRVMIKGRVASLLEVGTGFHPELTGRENIFLNGAILGMTRAEVRRKFDEIVAFAEVEKFLDTPVKRYSSGMYVRLAFAVAAHLEPEILVVDEVLAVGDAEFQKKCLGKMQDVAGNGRTILFVSHNMSALSRICKKGILLSAGAVVLAADIERSLSFYLNENSALQQSFLRAKNMPARKQGEQPEITIEQVSLAVPYVPQGKKFAVEIVIEVHATVRGIVFGFGFADLMGTRILSSDSDYSRCADFNFTKPGRYLVRAQIQQLDLAAASYAVDVGCRFADGRMIDNIPKALVVNVIAFQDTTVVQNSGYRTALARSSWEVREADRGA